MVKNEKSDDDQLFYGEETKGITFTEFDRKVCSFVIEEWGWKLGQHFWENTLPDLQNLDMTDDSDEYTLLSHCNAIYDSIFVKNCRAAETLYKTERFWTVEFQIDWRRTQYGILFVKLQKMCSGEALRQVVELNIGGTCGVRQHFMIRFGGAQSATIKSREKAFNLGMPKDVGGDAFEPFCDMNVKLNQLETERMFFWNACPAELRKD
jgi:hypothetical protein